MGQLLDIVTPLHKATKRNFLGRMQDEKIANPSPEKFKINCNCKMLEFRKSNTYNNHQIIMIMED